jgi:hypothetical protein
MEHMLKKLLILASFMLALLALIPMAQAHAARSNPDLLIYSATLRYPLPGSARTASKRRLPHIENNSVRR